MIGKVVCHVKEIIPDESLKCRLLDGLESIGQQKRLHFLDLITNVPYFIIRSCQVMLER